MAKQSADVLAAVFESEKHRLARHGWDQASAVEPFAELFYGLCVGKEEVFALEPGSGGSTATQIEFAVALADVLTRSGQPALHMLAKRTEEAQSVRLLSTVAHSPHKVDLNVLDSKDYYRSILHVAASTGKANLIAAAIELGTTPSVIAPPDINLQDSEGNTPLALAVAAGHTEAAEVLVRVGAHVSQHMVRNAVLGDSVEMAGLLITKLSEGGPAAAEMLKGVLSSLGDGDLDAAARSRLERAGELLVVGGAPIDDDTVYRAVDCNSERIVRAITSRGANGSLWNAGLRHLVRLVEVRYSPNVSS